MTRLLKSRKLSEISSAFFISIQLLQFTLIGDTDFLGFASHVAFVISYFAMDLKTSGFILTLLCFLLFELDFHRSIPLLHSKHYLIKMTH